MQISQDYNTSAYTIRSYNEGIVDIIPPLNMSAERPSGKPLETLKISKSMILMEDRLVEDWEPGNFCELKAEHFEQLLALKPEVVILGTGDKIRFPKPELTRHLISQHIGVEVMDNGAACRTYNFLTSDHRRVLLALLLG